MGLLVFLFSNLWGNRLGAAFAASILFNVILAGAPVSQLPAIWVGTFLKNFPMAFFWNMFAAAPFSHWLFGKLFPL